LKLLWSMIRLVITFIVFASCKIIMLDDKIDDNIYCMCMIRLMITFVVFASCKIIMVDDTIDDKFYCVWKLS
jgi:hypothetical protein